MLRIMLMHNGASMFGSEEMVSNESEKSFCFNYKWYTNYGYNHLTHQLDKLLALCYAMRRNAPEMVTNH